MSSITYVKLNICKRHNVQGQIPTFMALFIGLVTVRRPNRLKPYVGKKCTWRFKRSFSPVNFEGIKTTSKKYNGVKVPKNTFGKFF